jgi:hypothetical protein
MITHASARRTPTVLALIIAAGLAILPASPLLGAEPSPSPEIPASAVPSLTPAEAMCDSASDLRIIVAFLRATDVSEDGWVPLLVGAIAGLSEARGLAGQAGDTYRPLVDDLIGSLEGLRTTIDELSELDTVGSQVAAVGEAITDIGNAMDALSIALRTPCPDIGPDVSASPVA